MRKMELIERAIYDDLPYRLDLSIDKPFGLEIEAGLLNQMDRYFIVNDALQNEGYQRNTDSSVGGDFPLEIQTPLLTANKELWVKLDELSKRMQKCKIDFSRAAFQVNLDVSFSYEQIYYLLLFFRTFETVLYRFSTSFRYDLRDMFRAQSLKEYFKYANYKILNESYFNYLINNKKYAVALKYKENTSDGLPPNIIEFRTPNGCDDAWMWQNYINTFHKMCEYIIVLDRNEIDYSLCNGEHESMPFHKLWLDDAYYFADLIFKSDIDIIYFLKQYIGPSVEDAKSYLRKRR